MAQQQINLYNEPLDQLLDVIRTALPRSSYNYKKHAVAIENEEGKCVATIRLPLSTSVSSDLRLIPKESFAIYISIESGNAAICVMQGSKNVYHTTFSAYMTRKKQGYSQIKYLNKKGKSRAGSRVRLAETLEFFEKINLKLQSLFGQYDFDRIALYCSPTLIPYLHQSNEACPFSKDDERLYKIPLHIQQSNYTCLYGAIKKLMAPILFYESEDLVSIAVLGDALKG